MGLWSLKPKSYHAAKQLLVWFVRKQRPIALLIWRIQQSTMSLLLSYHHCHEFANPRSKLYIGCKVCPLNETDVNRL